MVVRGAPAIAIAAALSLAVEVSNLKDFSGTSDDAASFLGKKLEYLVSRYGYSNTIKILHAVFPFLGLKLVCIAVVQRL